MSPNLVSLLVLLNTGIVPSLTLDWGLLEGDAKAALLYNVTIATLPTNEGVLATYTNGSGAAAVRTSEYGYVMIPFTTETQRSKLSKLSKNDRFNVMEQECQPFENLAETKQYAEYCLSLKASTIPQVWSEWFSNMWPSFTLLECRVLIPPSELSKIGLKGLRTRCGLIFSSRDASSQFFGFTVGDQIDEGAPFLIGFGEYTSNLPTSRRGLHEFFKYPYGDGHLVNLVNLFSGREPHARAFIARQLRFTEIRERVKPLVQARVATNASNPTMPLQLMQAWQVQDYTVAILKLMISEAIEFRHLGPTFLFFYVSFDRKAETEVQESAQKDFQLGPLKDNEDSATLTLLNSFNPQSLYTTAHRPIFTNAMTRVHHSQMTPTGMIICIVNFVARRCVKVGRGYNEKIPILNHLLEAARRLVDNFKITDVNIVGALILSGALTKGWVGLDEVLEHFGKLIYDLLCLPLPNLNNLIGIHVPEQASFQVQLDQIFEVYGESLSLRTLIERRIAKRLQLIAAALAKGTMETPVAQPLKSKSQQSVVTLGLRLITAWIVGCERANLYQVFDTCKVTVNGTEQVSERFLYRLVIEQRGSVFVFGELMEHQESTWRFYVQDHLLAAHFSQYGARPGSSEGNIPESGIDRQVSTIIHILELVARKCSAWSLRAQDLDRTPAINVAIDISTILLVEGGTRNDELVITAVAHGLPAMTDITYEQLAHIFGNGVARTIGRLAENHSIVEPDTVTEAVERVKALLITMTILLYQMRQLTQQCHISGPKAKEILDTNILALADLPNKYQQDVSLAKGKAPDLIETFVNIHTALKTVLENGAKRFSQAPSVNNFARAFPLTT